VAAASPNVRRRRLAAELRRLRGDAGITIDVVAERIGLSKSAVSRIENGLVGVKLPVLKALLSAYGVEGDQAAVLERLSREGSQRGWWQVDAGEIPSNDYQTLVGLEAEAAWINDYSTGIVSGLLQTEAYAAALLMAMYPEMTAEKLERAVEYRVKRQARLADVRLWVILAEEGLERPVGGPVVMREQVERLRLAADDPRISLQLIGKESGEHAGMAGNFTLIGLHDQSPPEAVYLEGTRWDACVEDPPQVAVYSRSFDNLRAAALGFQDSKTRLRRIEKELVS
jgi:transcriptional regulator with XRE-family HTH domain